MTSPTDPTAILAQINAAREQTYQNIALANAQLALANEAAAAAARDRAAVAAMVQQSVTVDTSVGTRVFAGDVMIYGDTGWRNAVSFLDPANFEPAETSGYARVQRVGNKVTFVYRIKVLPTAVGSFVTTNLPTGFRISNQTLYIDHGTARNTSNIIAVGNTNTSDKLSINTPLNSATGQTFYGKAEWDTTDPWPSVLPS